MKINSIRLVNFRQFADVTIDLAEGQTSAVVFIGKNGAGKTNLLNALTWCLYGEEIFRSKQSQSDALPLVNVGPLNSTLPSGPCECSVKLRLVFDDGQKILIKRSQRFDVVAANDIRVLAKSELRIQKMTDLRGYDNVPAIDQWMNMYMPSRLRPYYILNTERLEQFFHQDTESKRVKDAILQIAQIDLLGRMGQRLENVRAELLSAGVDVRGNSPLESQLQKNRESLIKKTDELRESIRTKSESLEQLEARSAELETKMGGIEQAAKIVTEHSDKKARLEQVQVDFREAEERKHQTLATEAPKVLAIGAIDSLKTRIDEAWKSGRIPAPISPEFLEELLKREMCICGRELSQQTDASKEVRAFKSAQESATAYGHFLHAHSNAVAVLRDRAMDFKAKIGPYQEELDRLDREGKELRSRVEFLRSRMDELGIEDSDFSLIKEQWDRAQRAYDTTRDSLRDDKADMDAAAKELAEVERLIGAEMRKNQRKRDTGERLRFVERCLTTVGSAYDQLLIEAREHVSEALNRAFLQMIWKLDTFLGAHIQDDYSVKVESALGWDAGGGLGGGEDVCLALAFSQALGEVSGFELPLVLDSPMVKLDDEVKVRVAQTMAANLRDRQLLLLMKPDEYGGIRAALAEHLKVREINLEFDEKSQSTRAVG